MCNQKIPADLTLNGLFVDDLTATDRICLQFLSITNLGVSRAKIFLVDGSLVSKGTDVREVGDMFSSTIGGKIG